MMDAVVSSSSKKEKRDKHSSSHHHSSKSKSSSSRRHRDDRSSSGSPSSPRRRHGNSDDEEHESKRTKTSKHYDEKSSSSSKRHRQEGESSSRPASLSITSYRCQVFNRFSSFQMLKTSASIPIDISATDLHRRRSPTTVLLLRRPARMATCRSPSKRPSRLPASKLLTYNIRCFSDNIASLRLVECAES